MTSQPITAPLDQLPDELLLCIVTFSTNNPIDIIKFSHINKRMERVLNSYPNIFPQLITYDPLDPLDRSTSKLMNGYLFGKFWENPLKNGFAVLKEFTKRVFGPRSKTLSKKSTTGIRQPEKYLGVISEMKQQVDSEQKLVDCLKWSRRDPIGIIKAIESRGRAVERANTSRITHLSCILFSVIVQFTIGKLASVPSNERSLEMGLWWLPYIFWPLEIIPIVTSLACIGASCTSVVRALRMLIINPQKQWNANLYDGIVVLPLFYIATITVLRLSIISIRTLVYGSIGLELSYFESVVSIALTNRYSQYFGLSMLGLASFHNLSSLTGTYKLSDPITASFLSLSLFKYSGSLLSFIPLSLISCIISVKEVISNIKSSDKLVYSIPMGLGLSLGLLSFGHFSYLTFAPATSIFMTLFISTLKREKKEAILLKCY
ncbi:Hypothetical protein NAEGRDRAFT_73574 [Naegleria gruberi]|uniref:F-box domain-containing protein n=2 Tax=Naegleria gruberi TaxID=5762 RepID=D2VX08_NAEGR|nr:uncharacterized protein NAEGRDRAFT_73574 [Naegleria gruberi]EFC38538.1 Hypothetical protein NAEGRDRAFT_73574 [Naegleria gruberi]|eukprot:XP_002671282.1 Hypothetical protein NAEGRDRAFT_73574 [Naegleria gruberi strain NEG-M]